MTINYYELKNLQFPEITQNYVEKDVMLYALGLGFGGDPLDAGQLRYVYEKDLCVVPTMPVVFCHPGMWLKEPKLGLDWKRVVHGNVFVELHRPLATNATIVARTKNTAVVDKGPGKHAIIQQERAMYDQSSGNRDPVVTLKNIYIALGQGGFSSEGEFDDKLTLASSPVPDRDADKACELAVLPQAGLIYRLSGDYNPLHCDPEFARNLGYPRPILHGLCTFGITAHAVLKTCMDYDSSSFSNMTARFSSPVFPGETIRTEFWIEGDEIFFRSSIPDREVIVLDNGKVSVS